MSKTLSSIVTDVRRTLDEAGANDAGFDLGTDDTALDALITAKIGEAYEYVVGHADVALFSPDMLTIGTATHDTATTAFDKATVTTTRRLLKVVYAESSEWNYPSHEVIMWNDPEYASLFNKHTTGTPQRPKVGVKHHLADNQDKSTIELFGCKTGYVSYIEAPTSYDSLSSLKMSDVLYAALTYYLSALVLLTLREGQQSENMLAQAMALMGVDTSKAS